MSLYTCGMAHLARFRVEHLEIRTGKGCINFRPSDPIPVEAVREVVRHAMEHP